MEASAAQKGIYRPDASSDYIITALKTVPATQQRLPFTEWHVVKQAGVARANIAPTEASFDGSAGDQYSSEHSRQTVLQQHVDFFDLNRNGIITPYGTYTGFRLLSWSIALSLFATLVIHGGFSYFTLPPGHWMPDPFFRIYAANIHAAKHGSDTGAYDHEGRFRPQQFADFFSKYGRKLDDGQWGLTFVQAMWGVKCQRCVMDLFGIFAAIFEWLATYFTIWPADGIMRMEDVRGVYDGSYFFKVAGDRRAAYMAKHYNKRQK